MCQFVRGSPPHTRGIQNILERQEHVSGITPAYAGNTLLVFVCNTPVWDHPRIRGEYLFIPSKVQDNRGSPPHTRGIRKGIKFSYYDEGITPAYAGNTYHIHNVCIPLQDHPRIRGEYL